MTQISRRLHITEAVERSRRGAGIDIRADTRGEYFDIRVAPNEPVDYEVVDLRPAMRHLLLLARRENNHRSTFAATTSATGSSAERESSQKLRVERSKL